MWFGRVKTVMCELSVIVWTRSFSLRDNLPCQNTFDKQFVQHIVLFTCLLDLKNQ